jgi:cellulose synthase/poly-beta-1,6-N-acetylglucosamine synthase-like glycosyltransferase
MRQIDLKDVGLSVAGAISAIIWMFVLWWATHHLLFQLVSFFRKSVRVYHSCLSTESNIHFAVLYLTRNDFLPERCLSCIKQDYPKEKFRIQICDDSDTEKCRRDIDVFIKKHPSVELVRRDTQIGYKAGNLNHAIRETVKPEEEWIVVVDADQVLPPDYLSRLAGIVIELPSCVSFVQGAHDPDNFVDPATLSDGISSHPGISDFQATLGLQIQVFYERDMDGRNRYGFVPFLGHGAAVRRKAWEAVGGFPEIVSEDYAFAIELHRMGMLGVYVDSLRSWEAFPKDFGAFVLRIRKFASGSAELLRKYVLRFVLGRMREATPQTHGLTVRLDMFMLVAWFLLMPLILFNGYLSAWVCHRLWVLEIPYLHRLLAYLYLATFMAGIPVLASITNRTGVAMRYWFWATAVHTATIPLAAVSFLVHLVRSPVFHRTPKGNMPSPRYPVVGILMFLLGLGTICLSYIWWSPFSPVLACWGICFASFFLYQHLDSSGGIGKLSRIIVYIPGIVYMAALYTMWRYAYLYSFQ